MFSNGRFRSRHDSFTFIIAWGGVQAVVISLVVAFFSNSFWLALASAFVWMVFVQCFYVVRLICLVRAEKKRRLKFLSGGNGSPLNVIELQSRVIRAVGYDEPQATLMIEFRDGRIKYFCPVSKAMYSILISAPSPGTYYKHHIRSLKR